MRIAIVYNGMQPAARDAAEHLRTHAAATHDYELVFHELGANATPEPTPTPTSEQTPTSPPTPTHPEHPAHIDRIISLGGDGTLLRAVALLGEAATSAPVLGINFGKVGFLAGADATQLIEAFEYALREDVYRERRTLLDVQIECTTTATTANATDTSDAQPCAYIKMQALNELVIGRAMGARVVTTTLSINEHDIFTLRGDGLIVATATGSTAYALSAGGPVVAPGYDGMVIVPLASHTLVQRAIVTAPGDTVAVTLPDTKKADISLSCDGVEIDTGERTIERITVRASDRSIELIKRDNRVFYDTLAHEFF
ncbi:MAG: NAD(+)/NADH kinase [Coriobacteriia bacterium]|nr:NAD(+)/NADH kinase [Coriobacteriia bacterium]